MLVHYCYCRMQQQIKCERLFLRECELFKAGLWSMACWGLLFWPFRRSWSRGGQQRHQLVKIPPRLRFPGRPPETAAIALQTTSATAAFSILWRMRRVCALSSCGECPLRAACARCSLEFHSPWCSSASSVDKIFLINHSGLWCCAFAW